MLLNTLAFFHRSYILPSTCKSNTSALNAPPHQIELIVRDYGKGLPADGKPGGLGLQTMRHRAQMLGGRLTVENAPDGGTLVRCVAPYYRGKTAATKATEPSA